MKIIKILVFLICLSCGCFPPELYADSNSENVEYKIKAGYLYNFTKFITWPMDNVANFNICILGNDPFGELINPIEQLTASGRPIKLFRISKISDNEHCHIIFSHALNVNVPANGSLLVNDIGVDDSNNAAREVGGMIGFVNRQGRIKLQVNANNLQQAGLKVSAKLLEVSELVGDSGHE